MRNGMDRRFWQPFRILRVIAWLAVAVSLTLCILAFYKTRDENAANTSAVMTDPKEQVRNGMQQDLKLADGQMTQGDAENEKNRRAQEEMLPGVVIDGYTVIHAKAGSNEIKNINLVNSPKNTLYNMTYELRLPNDSPQGYEVLFHTGLITAGNTVLDVALSRPLEAGQYDCILFAQPYFVSDNSPTNNMAMSVLLDVN